MSKEDAETIANKLHYENSTAYVYECNLVNLKFKQVEDCADWTGPELIRCFLSDLTDTNVAKQYHDVVNKLPDMYSQCVERSEYVRQFVMSKGFNCLRYSNKVEHGLQNGCLCVIDNRCISSIELIETIDLHLQETKVNGGQMKKVVRNAKNICADETEFYGNMTQEQVNKLKSMEGDEFPVGDYAYQIQETFGAPQAGCAFFNFEDWYEVEDFLYEFPVVQEDIENGYAIIVELN